MSTRKLIVHFANIINMINAKSYRRAIKNIKDIYKVQVSAIHSVIHLDSN